MEYSISWFGPFFISEEWSNGLAAVFNKKTFFDTITDNVGVLSKSTLEKYLKKYLESGEIVRIGRNAYCARGKLKDYEYDYSDIAVHIAKIFKEDFYDLDFRISELYQMNRFLNHQIAHNVIFVFVEKELCISAFERLKKEYEGNILINPTEEDFFNYRRRRYDCCKKSFDGITKREKGGLAYRFRKIAGRHFFGEADKSNV